MRLILWLNLFVVFFVPLTAAAGKNNYSIDIRGHLQASDVLGDKVLPEYIAMVQDELLKELMSKMFSYNYEITQAMATIKRLRAEYSFTLSALYPAVNLQASFGILRGRTTDNESIRNDYQVSVPISYEIDVWKRLNAQSMAALLKSKASEYDRQALYMTLTAELMERYYTGLCLREQLSLFNEAMTLAVKINELLRYKYEAGMLSKDDLYSNEQSIKTISASQISVKKELSRIEHALKTLIGEYPADGWLRGTFTVPGWLQYVPAGVPSDLLQRRPDLRSMQLRIESAGYNVLAAKRAAFPSFELTANAQNSSNKLKDLTNGNNNSWRAFMQVSFPFFDGHRNKAVYEKEMFAQKEFTEEYKQLLLNIFKEVENSLNEGGRQMEVVTAMWDHNILMEKEIAVVEMRYKEGIGDLLKLFSKKQDLTFTKVELRNAELKLISYRIQLIRSLGGSWGKIDDSGRAAVSQL